jgi:hypothetical protein
MGDRSPKSKQRDQKQKKAAQVKESTKKQEAAPTGRNSVSPKK